VPGALRIEWIGRIGWREALEEQMKRVEARRAGAGPDTLLLLEHPPVITLGRRTDPPTCSRAAPRWPRAASPYSRRRAAGA
jgi:lipoyl(octanoyl) transferase